LEKNCPICGFHPIPANADKCPQCDADLACFTVLDAIPDEMPVVRGDGERKTAGGGEDDADRPLSSGLTRPVTEKRTSGKWVFPCAVFLLLLGLVAGLWIARTGQSRPSSPVVLRCSPMGIKIPVKNPIGYAPLDPSAFDDVGFFQKVPEKTRVESDDFKDAVNPVPKTETHADYEVTGDETLWRISKNCYGRGFYFPVLMELNPGLGVYNLEKGTGLKIFKEAARAEQLYHQIIHVVGKELWYGYRVIKGDNVKGIAAKIYGSPGKAKRIMNDNPHASFKPGERIRVELE
jgi:hypothetical protein